MVTKEKWGSTGGYLGFGGTATPGTTTLAVNSANIKIAFPIVLEANKTLSEVWTYVSAVGGTLGAGDYKVELCADASNAPSTVAETSTTVSATPTGAAIVKNTGFTTAMTAGTPYWLVISNAAASPGTNNFTFVKGGANDSNVFLSGSGTALDIFGTSLQTSDGGSTWTASSINAGGYHILLKYSDGTTDGRLHSAFGAETSANTVYAARELGNIFTTPIYSRLRVAGMTFLVSKSGTPTGNLRYRLYKGSTLVGTTVEIAAGLISTTARWWPLLFTTPVTMEPNTSYRAVIAESSQSDTSTNRFNTGIYSLANDATNLAEAPFSGTCQKTYLNSTWSETATDFVSMYLILSANQPYDVAGLRWPQRGNV